MDLFESWDLLPVDVQMLLEKHNESEGCSYLLCQSLSEDLSQFGFTFDYGLDGVAYGLRATNN